MTFESVKNQLISDLETKISESTSEDSIGYLLELRSWLLAGTTSLGSITTTSVLGTFQATSDGTGYTTGDIIIFRQTGNESPEYYNAMTDAVISTPNPSHLGPVGGSSSNVTVTSSALPSGAATAAKQPSLGTAGTSSTDVLSVQGIASGTPLSVDDGDGSLTVDGTVTANLGTLNGAATAANQTTGNTSLSSIDGKLPALATGRVPVDGSGVTQPVSAVSLPLPTGAATASNQAALNSSLGATNDAPATSNTGTASVISFIKRVISHLLATRIYVATTISTSGDNTVIAAPAAGNRIVITKIRIQGNTGTATTCLLKDGASTTVARLRTVADGSGLSEVYGFSDALRLTAATAFIINLSGANTHGVSVEYYLEVASTGLPV